MKRYRVTKSLFRTGGYIPNERCAFLSYEEARVRMRDEEIRSYFLETLAKTYNRIHLFWNVEEEGKL